MTKVKILLDSIDKVKNFVNTLIKFDCDFDISSSRYTIDAKSIMGIFSLDLSKPIELTFELGEKCDSGLVAEYIEQIKEFMIHDE